ncbi:MAG: efflux RND transporter permease subunit [Chloracidobacterium sp.]|nr:efflux RND transporter permease subunit [Chloracidobacterium sp.]
MVSLLLRFALQQRLFIVALGLALVGVGVYVFTNLRIEAYPDISDTQVVVISLYPGHAAEEVEQQVTVPVERALNNVPRVIARRSRTIFGLSVVELTFADPTDDYFARQLVMEKLRDAALPDGVTPSLGPLTSGIGEMYRYRLEGAGNDTMKLRELQDWVVIPRLLQVPGVADVAPFGGLVKQFQIEVDPLALEKYRLSVKQIADAINANNQNAGGAQLDNRQQSMVIRGVGLIQSVNDVENIVLDAANGVPVFVHDVGRVTLGAAPQTGVFGIDDESGEHQNGVEGIVLMRRWENPSEVLKEVKSALDELNKERLPAGVKIVPFYDRADLVNNTLRTVSRTLVEGLVIVIGVLLLFLGSVRAALLTALTIPLSLLFAFICMYLAGIPANLLSLGAIDFGIIVDGTLVMVEHIVHRLEELERGGGLEDPRGAVQAAALEIAQPIFFSLVILITAYIPLFTMERVERRLFGPMASTVASALLGSLALSLTLIPALATWLFRRGAKSWENPALRWIAGRYERILRSALRHAVLTVSVALALVAAAVLGARALGTEFLPQLDEGVIWIRANLPPGISLYKSAEIGAQMRAIIKQSPEVKNVMSQSGRNDSGTDPFGPNRNELLVGLQPYGAWPSGKTKRDLVEELGRKLRDAIPGATLNFTQPIIDTSTEMATGSSADLAVIISGADLKKLRDVGRQTLAILQRVNGAADTSIEQEDEQAQLRIRIKRDEVARYGINVSEVQDVIELAVGGRAVSSVFEGERKFDITVRYAPESRADAEAIGRILIPTRDGGRAPLAQLAEITVANGATIIARRENQRQITIRTNIRGRDQGGFVDEAQRKFDKEIKLPEGYQVAWGGMFENLERARKRLILIMPITIALIFALLFSTFGKTGYAGLVLMNVPFSLVGGIVALWVRGVNLSVSAAVGFISLFGVAVMSGVLLVAEINRQRGSIGVKEAVIDGSLKQMRPVLMMIVVATLGMIPAARATGIGSDVQRPLATVVVGGLLSTLFLTLLALPCLYYLFNRRREEPHDKGAVQEREELTANRADKTEEPAEEVLAD